MTRTKLIKVLQTLLDDFRYNDGVSRYGLNIVQLLEKLDVLKDFTEVSDKTCEDCKYVRMFEGCVNNGICDENYSGWEKV